MSVLVGRRAPDFCVPAVLGNGDIVNEFRLSEEIKNQYAVLFFYPLDFTFVCPSELIALDKRMDAFEQRGVKVISVSVDSHFTHNAWRNTDINDGGIGKVRYTMAADINHGISQSFGVEHPEAGVAFRAVFLIDKQGIVRSEIVNDLPIGRNIDEIVRLVDALQFHEENGEVCPAGWQKGQTGMTASPEGVASYLKDHKDDL